MQTQDRYPPDQHFGAQASRDERRAEDAAASSAQSDVAADSERKDPRAENEAKRAEDK